MTKKTKTSFCKISVIIPTKNEHEVIHKCLSSLYNQSIKPFEVIVVDGNSTDGTIKIVNQFPVKIILENGSESPNNARNLGIQNSKGDILLLADADVIFNKDCLKNALKYFQDPEVFAVVPSQKVSFHSRLEKIQTKWILGTSNSIRMGIGTIVPVQFLRKKELTGILFDPNLGFGDDTDFQNRLKQKIQKFGRIMYVSDSNLIVHLPHTVQELWAQNVWYGRTFLKYLSKYKSLKTILNLSSYLLPITNLILAVTSLFFPIISAFAIFGLIILLGRNIIACIRSRSTFFFDFIALDFFRSFSFFYGIIQGFFNKKIGR